MCGIEVLDQDEAHPAVDRHAREERLEGVDPTGRGADTHDQPSAVGRWDGLGSGPGVARRLGRTWALTRAAGAALIWAPGPSSTGCHREANPWAVSIDPVPEPTTRATVGFLWALEPINALMKP